MLSTLGLRLLIVVGLTGAMAAAAPVVEAKKKPKKSSLVVHAPKGALAPNASFKLTVSGKATGKANHLIVLFANRACKKTFKAQLATYSGLAPTFAADKAVHGKFKWSQTETNQTRDGLTYYLCAYLTNQKTKKTVVFASKHWVRST